MKIRIIIFLLLVMICGCKYVAVNPVKHGEHPEKSYISSVVSKKSISTGFVLTLKVEEIILGARREDNIIIKIRKNDPLFSVQEISQHLFIREKAGVFDYRNIFYVYDIAPDRYAAMREQFEKLNIKYYTNDFSKEILWAPVSCNIDVAMCQHEINLIADEYTK